MILKVIDFTNYKTAIQVQREIFSNEDGTLNFLASLDRDLFMKTANLFYPDDLVKYYLVYDNDELVGITGLYCEKIVCLDSAWIGWFGVLPQFRGRGLGEKILNKTIDLARKQGYETIRLYTVIDENKTAINLYEKLGFIGEKYNAEELIYNCYIFSKSLTNNPTDLWNNRMLKLSYQTELDHMEDTKIKEILIAYENIANERL